MMGFVAVGCISLGVVVGFVTSALCRMGKIEDGE